MMRSWKKEWDVPIGGLLVDTLAYQFIDNYSYRDKSFFYYDDMCRDCFKWMSEQNDELAFWKAYRASAKTRADETGSCNRRKPNLKRG